MKFLREKENVTLCEWMRERERERESIYKFGMRESWEKRDLRGEKEKVERRDRRKKED